MEPTRVSITLQFDIKMVAALEDDAEKLGISLRKHIPQILEDYLSAREES